MHIDFSPQLPSDTYPPRRSYVEITVAWVALFGENIFDHPVCLLRQAEYDFLTPNNLCRDDDREVPRTLMNAYGSLVTNFAVVLTADINDSDGDLICLDFGATSILHQECEVA